MASRPVAGGWEVSLRYHGGFEKGFRQIPPILPIDVQILVSQNFGVLQPLQRFSGCCIFLQPFPRESCFGGFEFEGITKCSRKILEKGGSRFRIGNPLNEIPHLELMSRQNSTFTKFHEAPSKARAFQPGLAVGKLSQSSLFVNTEVPCCPQTTVSWR